MDSVFTLDRTLPKGRGIEAALRAAISAGAFPEGARLPSTRELAAEFQVARGTVVAVIDDLVAEGVLEARARAGVFVARHVATPRPLTVLPEIAEPRFDLRPGRPERGSFPTHRWLAGMKRAATALDAGLPGDDPAGDATLRVELAAYLARARGLETDPNSIVICGGFRNASLLIAAALARLGSRTVAIEDPSLPEICQPWHATGWQVIDLPVDDGGAHVETLPPDIAAVVLTPSHQFPLGGALTPSRRRQVTEWTIKNDSYIVEDDYDGEFRFDRRPIPALHRTAPEHVIYVGSVSKTLDPRLRLGWMVLPSDLVTPVMEAAQALTGGVPLLNQLAFTDLLASGDYERHIRRQRREYARRRTRLHDLLRDLRIDAPGIPAGLHACIPLAESANIEQAGDLAIHTLDRYTRSHTMPAALIAGFATPSRGAFEPALDALARILRPRNTDAR